MIQRTFCHIKGITMQKEIMLWQTGIKTWDDFFERKNNNLIEQILKNQKTTALQELTNTLKSIKKQEFETFKQLPRNQHWRLYEELKNKTCFLDIETTGLSKTRNDITLVGIHSNEGTKIFRKNKNLEDFKKELKKYETIVTFNGSCFDIPFIKHKFSDLEINQFHLDLRFIMAKLGYRGGLKNIEVQLGITRSDELENVDGLEAVRLWKQYEKGNLDALKKLEKYLKADVENLKILMDFAYRELEKTTIFHNI